MAQALTIEQLFDSIAVRVKCPQAWSQEITIDSDFTDIGKQYRMVLSNGAPTHCPDSAPGPACG